jgi:hypothetical protein
MCYSKGLYLFLTERMRRLAAYGVVIHGGEGATIQC